MIERLNEALAECLREQEAIEAGDFELEIQEKVAAYESQVRAELAEKKSAELVEVSYQIKALNRLIEKEEQKLVAEPEAPAVTPEEVASEFLAENA